MSSKSTVENQKAEDKTCLASARAWLRRSPGPDAWSNLAACYATRNPPDLKKARRWYRRAALKRHDVGSFEYGIMLLEGEGGPKRPANGRRYLEHAASLGYIPALDVLAYAFSEGAYGYRRSSKRAKQFERAAQRARLAIAKRY